MARKTNKKISKSIKKNINKNVNEKITLEAVKHVSDLARLKLDDKELKKMQRDLNEILIAFKDLDNVETDKVKASFHPTDVKDVFREDKQEQCWDQNKALSNTKHKENGFFKGPKAV